MKKLVFAAALGAASLALHLPAMATTNVKRVSVTSPALAQPAQAKRNSGNGGHHANNEHHNNPHVGGHHGNHPNLGNGCNASGHVPKKCKPSRS